MAELNSAELETAARALMQQKRLTLLGHSIPDGDCVGAVTALMWALANMGKDVNAIIEDGVPPTYRFLNGSERISSLIDLPPIYDCLVYLDCATRERVGERLSRLIPPAATVINIDHHISNQGYGTVNLVDAGASSTCEIVFT